ncbi:MAG: LysR family transcriptional regulator [Alphaproteobacteria bacterium]|nr:LysR family transcriptional regulator [Alphaproteobacteria bacterium]
MPANIPMQWRRSFMAVAELGTVSRAAQETELSQPSVSQHMGQLQEAPGRTPFDRRRPLRLSKAGKALLPRTRYITRLHD